MDRAIDFNRLSVHKEPEASLGFLLWRVSTFWRRAIEEVLKPLKLTHPQFVVLATIAWLTREGEKVSQVAIARQAALDPNTTSQILRGLQAKKLIKRSHSLDERSKSPHLTEKGNEILAIALPLVEQRDRLFFAAVKDSRFLNELHNLANLI